MLDRKADTIVAPLATLGEGALWDWRRGIQWWVDVRSPCVHGLHLETGAVRSFRMPEVATAVVLRQGGRMLVCLKSGLFTFDPETGATGLFLARDDGEAGNRLNDTTVDAKGRIWTSTMWDFARRKTGSVFCIGPDCRLRKRSGPYWITNGICFSPDHRTMYFSDTSEGRILAFSFDLERGELGESRIFVDRGVAPGHPDGATVDSEGFVWSARFGAGAVVRFAPDGRVDRTIELPATQITSCAFGGAGLDTLFVTSGTQGLVAEQLKVQESAGALFALRPDVRGMREHEYAG